MSSNTRSVVIQGWENGGGARASESAAGRVRGNRVAADLLCRQQVISGVAAPFQAVGGGFQGVQESDRAPLRDNPAILRFDRTPMERRNAVLCSDRTTLQGRNRVPRFDKPVLSKRNTIQGFNRTVLHRPNGAL